MAFCLLCIEESGLTESNNNYLFNVLAMTWKTCNNIKWIVHTLHCSLTSAGSSELRYSPEKLLYTANISMNVTRKCIPIKFYFTVPLNNVHFTLFYTFLYQSWILLVTPEFFHVHTCTWHQWHANILFS